MRDTRCVGRWLSTTVDDGDHVHVMPIEDLVVHDESNDGDCICGPVTMPVARRDGSMGWLLVHSSLDGRELTEP